MPLQIQDMTLRCQDHLCCFSSYIVSYNTRILGYKLTILQYNIRFFIVRYMSQCCQKKYCIKMVVCGSQCGILMLEYVTVHSVTGIITR